MPHKNGHRSAKEAIPLKGMRRGVYELPGKQGGPVGLQEDPGRRNMLPRPGISDPLFNVRGTQVIKALGISFLAGVGVGVVWLLWSKKD
jgi:hypothetical protein